MEINGSKRINDINVPAFKGDKKETSAPQEKQAEASADEALNAYGRAMVNQPKAIQKEIFSQLAEEAIKNYEEKLNCDKEKKAQFIQRLREIKTDNIQSEEAENNINRSYLLSGYNEDDMQLIKQLFEEKDENGNFRFNVEDIVYILSTVTAKNRDFVETIINTKDSDGNFRFKIDVISLFIQMIEPEKKDALDLLLNVKDKDGNFRFMDISIFEILLNVTSENKDIFQYLINAKDEDDDFRFNESYIPSILAYVTPENRDVLESLLTSKAKNGQFRFNEYEILEIFNKSIYGNNDVLATLINAKENDGSFRFNSSEIDEIFNKSLYGNQDVLATLINAKDNDGNFRFNSSEIDEIFNKITTENRDILEYLINLKARNGYFGYNYMFSCNEIISIIDNVTPVNRNLLEHLINAKDIYDNFRFSANDISFILRNIYRADNKVVLEKLINAKDSSGDFRFSAIDIALMLHEVIPESYDLLEPLINAKDSDGDFRFGASDIASILNHVTLSNYDVVENLINAKTTDDTFRFTDYDITSILSQVTIENKDALETLINVKDSDGNFRFDATSIASILRVFKPENKELLELLIQDNIKDRYDDFSISLILRGVTTKNKDIIKALIKDNSKDRDGNFRFNGNNIASITDNVTSANLDILETLITAKEKDGNYRFNGNNIPSILYNLANRNRDILENLINGKNKDGNYRFKGDEISKIFQGMSLKKEETLREMLKNYEKLELTPKYIEYILNPEYNISLKDIKTIERIIGKSVTRSLNAEEIQTACQFKVLLNKQNVNEISQRRKKEIVRNLVESNTGVFNISDKLRKYMPLLPKNQEEYCTLLPTLVKSLGIETNELSESEISEVEKEITSLSGTLKTMSDEEFKELEIEQEYTTEKFIKDTYEAVKELTEKERQKVYDYFGFELKYTEFGTQTDENPQHKFEIKGYPVNLNNEKKLAQIDSAETKAVVEQLRPYVIKYSENNQVKSNNKEVENILNEIMGQFPELRNEIGKTQHKTHDYDLIKHSLKVMQKISQNPEYEKLNKTDKKLMLLASLFHDITKPNGLVDKTHPRESAFDTYYILKKMKLPKQEEIKLYTLINSHEWLAYVNNERIKGTKEAEKRMQSVAFDLQYDNLFEMSKIFTVADLKAVKTDDGFYLKHKEAYEKCSKTIENYIKELKMTQPIMPVTQIPKADRIEKAITQVNSDGSTNIKGVYKNKDGLVIIKYNEVENEDWEKIGFPKGSISRGIDAKGLSSRHGKLKAIEEVNTGNIKFFVHGLDYSNQLSKFAAFALPDSDALLSVSYAERPESKYRFFRTQGVLLNTPTKYMHGGGETDAGSGCAKNLDLFKKNYIFGGNREADRKYISNLIKEALNMSDKEYLEFVKENADKPFTSIEPEEIRNTIIKAFSTINSNTRRGNRAYNEMYITNPEVMGVFAYSADDNVGNIMEFIEKQPEFLKQYALKNDFPFVVFGD